MFILNQKIIIGGERWFTPMKDLKPVDGLKLLVASSDNDQYRSRNALIRRHIEKMDASLHVGTKEFDISRFPRWILLMIYSLIMPLVIC